MKSIYLPTFLPVKVSPNPLPYQSVSIYLCTSSYACLSSYQYAYLPTCFLTSPSVCPHTNMYTDLCAYLFMSSSVNISIGLLASVYLYTYQFSTYFLPTNPLLYLSSYLPRHSLTCLLIYVCLPIYISVYFHPYLNVPSCRNVQEE